jgi:NADPH-dependent 2,4-dienoyl-CoA reductase/sulfur reductase-like enzyme
MSGAMIPESCDLAVIGAGPAGLAAAATTAQGGLSVVLLDENAAPGGQIYRAVATSPLASGSILGADYWAGGRLVEAMRDSGATYVLRATVWMVTPERQIGISVGGASRQLTARRIILATGALERPFPIPGWTLPGVMTVGAAQTLLKSSGLVPEGRTVLAGCGPLLWLLAWQYLQAGAKVDAILDTTPRANWRRTLSHAPGFMASPYFAKGLKLMRAVRAQIRVVSGVTALRAEGDVRVSGVRFTTRAGEERLAVDQLLLHQGVVPNVNLANAIGVPHRWDDEQLCFVPELDTDGRTGVPGVSIAGDGAGIGGAETAAVRGQIAALAALQELAPSAGTDTALAKAHADLRRLMRGRGFLDRLYRPAAQFRVPPPETIVCRCEEVTAGQITETVALGVTGPNQLKSFLRCGMGPCQGRQCGLTVTELIAQERGATPDQVGYYRLRPPVKPITLGELAAWPQDEAAIKAVARG